MIEESDRQRRAADFIWAAEERGEDVSEIVQRYLEIFLPDEVHDQEIEDDKARIKRLTLKEWNINKIDEMIDYLKKDKPLEIK